MALTTRVAFTYGHDISASNQYINFSEDSGVTELAATIEIGSYYLNEFGNKVATALNEIGDNTYTVTLDRTTRKFTISADANFDLLVTTGTQVAISAFSLIGFTTNRSGSNSYEADVASGFLYEPQAPVRDYQPFDNNQQAVQAKVNESSSGDNIEVVKYGTRKIMSLNIKYVTDIDVSASDYLDNDPTAVSKLRTFMEYITGKKPIEFIPDKTDLTTFTPCILESTRSSRDGVGFELRELYSEGLSFYFESGLLQFRQIS